MSRRTLASLLAGSLVLSVAAPAAAAYGPEESPKAHGPRQVAPQPGPAPAPLPPRPPVAEEPPPPASYPDKELEAAAGRWKLQRAAERIRRRGAGGQHDLFWQILALWKEDEKARADKDLVAVMDWLLFTARLWRDKDLGPASAKQVPELVPGLGERLLEARLEEWVSAATGRRGANPPWGWPEFSGENRARLARTAGKLMETGPRHNPLTRVWIAAALLAAGGESGAREMAEARKALAENLAGRYDTVVADVGRSLATGGVKAGLPLLLDVAADLLADSGHGRIRRPTTVAGWPATLVSFYHLVGWFVPSSPGSARGAIAGARAWLKTSGEKLSWDAKAGRYVGGAPQPGFEKFQRAAAAIEKRHGFECRKRLSPGPGQGRAALQLLLEFVALAGKKADLAAEEDAAELAAGLASLAVESASGVQQAAETLEKLHAAGSAIPVRVISEVLGPNLAHPSANRRGLISQFVNWPSRGLLEAGCRRLAPDLERRYAEAVKAGDPEGVLTAAMGALYAGGKVPQAELVGHVRKAAPGTTSGSTVQWWAQTMIVAGRKGGLRLCLAQARAGLADNGAGNRYGSPLQRFEVAVGWSDGRRPRVRDTEEDVARAERWLDANESRLKWDAARRCFLGAPPPGAEHLVAAGEAVEKRYGLKLDGLLAAGGRDAARKLFSEVLELMEKNPAAAADAELGEVLTSLVEVGGIMEDRILRARALVKVPKFNRPLGVRLWAAYMRESLNVNVGGGRVVGLSSGLCYLDRQFAGLDRSVLIEARATLKEEFGKRWAESGKLPFGTRTVYALAYVYVGASPEEVKLDELLAEADKLGEAGRRVMLSSWGMAMVEAGNRSGLEVMLRGARMLKTSRAHDLGMYLYMAGRSDQRWNTKFHRLGEAELIKKIDEELAWLKANADGLAFDPAAGRFKLRAGGVKPPPPAQGEKEPEVF
jgi:hypothetical protein